MIFGLRFTNASGQVSQFAIDTDLRQLFFRVAKSGGWTDWKRADVDRNQDGSLAEIVAESGTAQKAKTADKLSNPVTVKFTGGATGTMKFDGSKDLSVKLDTNKTINDAINGGPVSTAINDAIADHIRIYHSESDNNR